ncbi:PEP-CTERM sorting domain-containing protein [Flocculibacter collagenilyticus]|uniref:PEP-CTERM sorting domain-containing protein n=1 Tax=Flocculibacter collagenilyticus TaxID=2744479 RepID=UPI0018F3F980|nr:PEP-CTERM sorting domain-containing protein [Flocculibacter collagenilyticus]
MNKLLLGAVALGLSFSSEASLINVGGVQWDPMQVLSFPGLTDFSSNGTVFENFAITPGDIVSGWGQFTHLNSAITNQNSFCPGCELTYTFDMELVSFTGTPASGDFIFKDLMISMFVDHTPDFNGTEPTASDGDLWLELALPVGEMLTGIGTNLGTGSDAGGGFALLEVVGGMAAYHFDTNRMTRGADMQLTSSFQATGGAPNMLNGTFDLTAKSVPEPSTLGLFGAFLLGFAGLYGRKRD